MTSIPGYCIPRGITVHFTLLLPPKQPKMGGNRRFQAKCAKYSNFYIIITTNAIPTKFCIVIKTLKFSLLVVSKFAPQIQNGGRPLSWEKKINCYISATISPISTKFCMLTHIYPSNPKSCLKNQIFKIQDGERPPFWKMLNAISPQPFDQFWCILAWRCILGLPMWRETKNLKN